jgi:hypothetical protein
MSPDQRQDAAEGAVEQQLAAVGIVVTPEGKARARREMDDAAARRDYAARDAFRARAGLPPASAA